MFSVLFSQEPISGNAAYSIHSFFKINEECSPLTKENLPPLGSNIPTELSLEECEETVYVLICETQCIHFL